MRDWQFAVITPDEIQRVQDAPGFIPVGRYAAIDAVADEIGAVGHVRYALGDPVLQKRREEIQNSRHSQ
jgi:hypothetical protein